MMKAGTLIMLIWCMAIQFSYGQSDFKSILKSKDPAKDSTSISTERKIEIHSDYLSKAKVTKDTASILYGLLYLYVDYYKADNYKMLQQVFGEAEILTTNSNNKAWNAAVKMRKAHLLEIFDNDIEGALSLYEEIYAICSEINDQFCITESLEQLGDLNGKLSNYAQANKYYNIALKQAKIRNSKPELALVYNNYGLLLSNQDRFLDAERYLDTAIIIAKQNNDLFKETTYRSNLSSVYNKNQKSKKAIEEYKKLIEINNENGWHRKLLYNYAGIADAYENIGNLKKTNEYTHEYYNLNDSINSVQVKKEIENLRVQLKLDKTTIQNSKNIEQLQVAKLKNERLLWFLAFSIIGLSTMIYVFLKNRKTTKNEKIKNLEYLEHLKTVISKKNKTINNQEIIIKEQRQLEGTSANSQPNKNDELQLLDVRLLNDEDISAFKTYFDRAYPNLVIKVRQRWPELTAAEERLLMLIKLKIKSKESAEILGIAQSSVKKSRNRLRRRLDLDINQNLEDFINSL